MKVANKKKVDKSIVKTAIVSLALLECVALTNGINGTLYSVIIAVIAGLGGLVTEKPKIFK
jgi:hypothetical protein